MIKTCTHCGGLKATEHGEQFAGTPCRCRPVSDEFKKIAIHTFEKHEKSFEKLADD